MDCRHILRRQHVFFQLIRLTRHNLKISPINNQHQQPHIFRDKMKSVFIREIGIHPWEHLLFSYDED